MRPPPTLAELLASLAAAVLAVSLIVAGITSIARAEPHEVERAPAGTQMYWGVGESGKTFLCMGTSKADAKCMPIPKALEAQMAGHYCRNRIILSKN